MAENCPHWRNGRCLAPGYREEDCSWSSADYSGCALIKAAAARDTGGSVVDQLRAGGLIPDGVRVHDGGSRGPGVIAEPKHEGESGGLQKTPKSRKPPTPNQMNDLRIMPFVAAEVLVGKPDGTVEDRCRGQALAWSYVCPYAMSLARNADGTHSSFVCAVFGKFLSDPRGAEFNPFLIGLRDPFDVLRKGADILERKASDEESKELKTAVIAVCMSLRSAAGLESLGRTMSDTEFSDALNPIAAAMKWMADA